jgi:iron(III) transport system permease protein
VALATALAYAALRCAAPGAALAHRVLTLGLVLPPLLPPLGLLVLTGGRTGFATLVAAQVVAFLPYAYLAAGHALAAVHPDQEDAAESLGAGRLRILTRVTLVALRPGLVTAAAAVALLCAADLVNPAIAGGEYAVLTTLVFAAAGRGAEAAAPAVWLAVPCLLLAAVGRWRSRVIVSLPVARGRLHRPTPAAVPLGMVAAGVTLALLAVYAAVVAAAAGAVSGRGIATLARAYGGSLVESVTAAAAAAVAGTVLALLVAGLVTRGAPGAALLEHAALLPSALPGLVLGLGLLLAYPAVGPESVAVAALAGLVATPLPMALAAAVAAVRRLDPDLTTVAASLGAGRRRAFSRILAPLLTPVAASLLAAVFIRALVAVSVVALLHGPGPGLAPVVALDVALAGRPGEACVPAVALSVVVLVVVGLRRTLPGREHASVWFL